MSSVIKITMF